MSPPCEHAWSMAHELVGGLAENPGVWGSGHGSVRTVEACTRCGARRHTDYGASGSRGQQVTATEIVDAEGWRVSFETDELAE